MSHHTASYHYFNQWIGASTPFCIVPRPVVPDLEQYLAVEVVREPGSIVLPAALGPQVSATDGASLRLTATLWIRKHDFSSCVFFLAVASVKRTSSTAEEIAQSRQTVRPPTCSVPAKLKMLQLYVHIQKGFWCRRNTTQV